jgi:hypothetical protein
MTRLQSFGRDVGTFIEEIGAPALAIGLTIIFGLRGLPWLLGVIANG